MTWPSTTGEYEWVDCTIIIELVIWCLVIAFWLLNSPFGIKISLLTIVFTLSTSWSWSKVFVFFFCFASKIYLHVHFISQIAGMQISNAKDLGVNWVKDFIIGSLVEGEIQEIKELGAVIGFKNHRDIVGFLAHKQCKFIYCLCSVSSLLEYSFFFFNFQLGVPIWKLVLLLMPWFWT